jgi:hypothetical protein
MLRMLKLAKVQSMSVEQGENSQTCLELFFCGLGIQISDEDAPSFSEDDEWEDR